jgi:mannitol/fructose-specific phosphotransferase system IIA component (Ntr-type)
VISKKTVEYLRSAAFLGTLKAGSETEAIDLMLESLTNKPEVKDLGALREAVFERQRLDPPLLPGGIAFPHARTDSVASIVIVVAGADPPIEVPGMSIRLLFLIGAPRNAVNEYLELTSFLARHLRGGALIDRLTKARNITEFIDCFAEPSSQ